MTAPTIDAAAMSSAQLLLAWQNKHTAERKPGLSMSALGSCRRRGGYHLHNTPVSNLSGSVQSAMGSSAHEKIAEAAAEMFPDDLIEHPVEFAGIPGRIDRLSGTELIDTKTTTSRWLAKVKVNGPSREWRWQTGGYAAALIAQGHAVRTIRIDVLARDTGEEWQHTRPFDAAEVREALAWVAEIRSTELEFLARDYAPDSPFCKGCPFRDLCWDGHVVGRDERSVLYIEDPDASGWMDRLGDARARKAAATKDEAEARGALDALRPNDEGTALVAVPGAEQVLRFTVTNPERVDTTQVRQDYKAAGRPVPLKPSGKPTVRVELVGPEAE